MIIDRNSTRVINNMEHKVITVDGLDRVEINNKLHELNVKMSALQTEQMALVAMRDAIDRECEMMERAESADDLFAEMFGGWCNKLMWRSGQCPPLPPKRPTLCL